MNFRFLGQRRAQFKKRDACVPKFRARMHSFDRQFDLVDRLGVISHANEVRSFEALIGNVLGKRMLVI